MRTFGLLFLGGIVGWAASGVDWSREAVGEESLTEVAPSVQESVPDHAPQPIEQMSPTDKSGPNWIYEESQSFDNEGNSIIVPTRRDANDPSNRRTIVPRATRRVQTAQEPNLVGRFQASAYGSPSGHGCYVIDTMTGKTWHVAPGIARQVVNETLVPPTHAQSPWLTPDHQPPAGMSVAPTPSYTEATPGLGTTNRPAAPPTVVPTPVPRLAEPSTDDADQ